ncbi:MAG: DUF3473 domain-containing protein [Alphaproteobacteria bacterium]|nr:DUF3473 domain-containing protein [Alphaproteobacteria bacterium]
MTSKGDASLDLSLPVSPDTKFGEKMAFTVDVEEWFQVGAFENSLHREDWPRLESRVERQTYTILEILAKQGVEATFFCLGWVAERHPLLISAIHNAGHEVACHGSDHRRLFTMDRDSLFADIHAAKAKLEDAIGAEVIGYRAPSFSLTPETWWAYECLEELGFRYSSSLYPMKSDHYGMPEAPRLPFWPIGEERVLEVPMTVFKALGRPLPASGGGYFRLLPYWLGRFLFQRGGCQTGAPAIFYMHPWEVDPEQPFVDHAPWLSRFRHYTGQSHMAAKVEKLLKLHSWGKMIDIFSPAFSSFRDGRAE